jgi:hypothetical protein
MSELIKREIPVGLATFIIVFMFFDYYIETEITRNLSTLLQDWAVIIAVTAVGVGIINAIIHVYHRVQTKEQYWYLDIWMLVFMVALAIPGLMGVYGTHPMFEWLMKNVYLPIDASIYAMVLFDIVSAFYRTFRVRNREAFILLLCAVLIMMRNAPITGTVLPQALSLGNWLYSVPASATSRGFLMVAALGIIGFAIRILLGHEKTTIGVVD